MIERLVAQYPFRSLAASLILGALLAAGAAVVLWYQVMLPEKLRQLEIIEGTKLIRLMAADSGKRKCMDAVMLRGRLVCLEQGGK